MACVVVVGASVDVVAVVVVVPVVVIIILSGITCCNSRGARMRGVEKLHVAANVRFPLKSQTATSMAETMCAIYVQY